MNLPTVVCSSHLKNVSSSMSESRNRSLGTTGAVMVGMGEIQVVSGSEAVLMALGLGSCVGLCAYDVKSRVAGMAHVVLPDESGTTTEGTPGKFASTVLPALLSAMQAQGAGAASLRFALVGGAQLFAFAGKGSGAPRLDIGNRNGARLLQELSSRNLPVIAQDLGGNAGRTVHLFAADGRIRIKTIGQGERDLVKLSDFTLYASTEKSKNEAGLAMESTKPLSTPGTTGRLAEAA